MAYLRSSTEALQKLIEASGILTLVPEGQRAIADSVAFELSNLDRALAVGDDLEAAIHDTKMRQKLIYAGIVLAGLRDLFQRRIGPSAGLTQGFNSLDGD